MRAGELFFGNFTEEEPNVAESILKSLLKLGVENRIMACQNIVISGGGTMIPGFKARLGEELKDLLRSSGASTDSDQSFDSDGKAIEKPAEKIVEETELTQFSELAVLRSRMRFAESCFPPNCQNWVGASLLGSLNNEIDRFVVTEEDFKKSGNKVPDRFGEAFIYGRTTKEPYFNKDFEIMHAQQKLNLYNNTTPYSARSFTSARDSMQQMNRRSIAERNLA